MTIFPSTEAGRRSPEHRNGNRMLPYAAILSIVVFGVYLNSTAGGFVFDDWPLIVRNSKIHYLSQWREILLGYRPIRTLTLAILYHFFGENPIGYHVVNLSIHTAAVFVVFRLVRRLTEDARVAFFSAMIFGIHPVQTDSVAYISGIRDTLCGLFYVSSFHFFLRYRADGRKADLAALSIFALLGILTKELAASLVLMFLAYDFIQALETRRPSSIREMIRAFARAGWQAFHRARWFYAGFASVLLAAIWYYVILRKSSAQITDGGVLWHGGSRFLNYYSIPKIIVYYIKLLLYPVHLLADYKFFPIVAKSLGEAKALLAILAVAGLLAAALRMAFDRKIPAFAILWFFVALSPGLNIIPHHEFMAEHYLYIPSIGFSMLVGLAIAGGIERAGTRRSRLIWIIAGGFLFSFYAGRTMIRNLDWQNDLRLSTAQLRIRPDSPRTLAEMSYIYMEMNLLKSAQAAAEKALSIAPGHLGARNNLGVIYSRLGEQEKALEEFKKASKSQKNLTINTYANMGISYMVLGDEENGVRSFEEALKHDPFDPLSLISLAHIYLDRGDLPRATEFVRKNLQYHSDNIESYVLLAKIYEKVLQFDAAVEVYRVILELDPEEKNAKQRMAAAQSAGMKLKEAGGRADGDPSSVENAIRLADLYLLVDEPRQAKIVLEQSMNGMGESPDLLRKQAEVLFILQDYDGAEAAARKVLKASPEDPAANLLLAKRYALELEFEQSEKALKMAEKRNPTDVHVQETAKTIRVNAERHARVRQLRNSGSANGQIDLILGQIYESMGLYLPAVERFLAVPAGTPFSLKAKRELARLYFSREGFRSTVQGVRVLEQILKEVPDDLWALNRLGFAYFTDMRDFERAGEYFAESLARHPDQKEAGRLIRIKTGLDRFRHAVLVENEYMLPYMKELNRLDSGEAPRPQVQD